MIILLLIFKLLFIYILIGLCLFTYYYCGACKRCGITPFGTRFNIKATLSDDSVLTGDKALIYLILSWPKNLKMLLY